MSQGTIHLDLPYPPSVNHYWHRSRDGGMYIGSEGVAFRQSVVAACRSGGIRPLAGKLELRFAVYPPDRIRRDLDNVQKALLDAIKHGGCCEDDSQIKHIDATMRDHNEKYPAGRTLATLARWTADPGQVQLELSGDQAHV